MSTAEADENKVKKFHEDLIKTQRLNKLKLRNDARFGPQQEETKEQEKDESSEKPELSIINISELAKGGDPQDEETSIGGEYVYDYFLAERFGN